MIKNRVSLFIVTFLIIGFFFLTLPEKGYSGTGMTTIGCCQMSASCFNVENLEECVPPLAVFNPGEVCVDGRECFPVENTQIPTLSEWGLVAMAGILGIVGFMVIRRMKATA